MSDRILIVAAHPDDEVLGAGGTIALHTEKGDEVQVVFMADGVSSRQGEQSDDEVKQRNKAAFSACELLACKPPIFLGLPDNKMDTLALLDVVQPLEAIINKLKPSTIYTHHYGDLNLDHRITHQAVLTACRPQGQFSVKTILCFEVLSSTEWQTPSSGQSFEPNWFIDISTVIDKKNKALTCYSKEMRDPPHTRSIENTQHLSALRGAQVHCKHAEAFMLCRKIC
jgi:LmbE family N-acetylglucosaminyl deacetylase